MPCAEDPPKASRGRAKLPEVGVRRFLLPRGSGVPVPGATEGSKTSMSWRRRALPRGRPPLLDVASTLLFWMGIFGVIRGREVWPPLLSFQISRPFAETRTPRRLPPPAHDQPKPWAHCSERPYFLRRKSCHLSLFIILHHATSYTRELCDPLWATPPPPMSTER